MKPPRIDRVPLVYSKQLTVQLTELIHSEHCLAVWEITPEASLDKGRDWKRVRVPRPTWREHPGQWRGLNPGSPSRDTEGTYSRNRFLKSELVAADLWEHLWEPSRRESLATEAVAPEAEAAAMTEPEPTCCPSPPCPNISRRREFMQQHGRRHSQKIVHYCNMLIP